MDNFISCCNNYVSTVYRLPMMFSASGMFACSGVNVYQVNTQYTILFLFLLTYW